MSIADDIYNFFKNLGNFKNSDTNVQLPPTYVVRSPDITPSTNPILAANQPKIERDLVKVGELPTLSQAEDNKVSKSENSKDAVNDSDYISAYKDKYGVPTTKLATTIYETAKKFGESPELMFKIANHESGGFQSTAVNPRTKAAGLFQFLPSTWRDVQDRLGGKKQGIIDPLNPEDNSKAAALYIADIKKQLSKVKDGSKITDQDIYLGHFSGAGRASQVLKALGNGKGNRPASDVYLPREIKNNQPVFYHNAAEPGKPFKPGTLKTIQEVYDTITQNVNKEDTKDISFYLPKSNRTVV